MATTQTKSLPTDQFLNMAINLLHKAFIEQNRTEAKKLFRAVAEGRIVPLTNVQMEDKSVVRFDIGLEHSEYRGKLNFGAFRASLSTTLANLVKAIQGGHKITTFSAENNANSLIFGITGVTMENDIPAVMVISVQVSERGAAVMLRPMYLNYEQFLESQESEA